MKIGPAGMGRRRGEVVITALVSCHFVLASHSLKKKENGDKKWKMEEKSILLKLG